jgi:hypothetical protein
MKCVKILIWLGSGAGGSVIKCRTYYVFDFPYVFQSALSFWRKRERASAKKRLWIGTGSTKPGNHLNAINENKSNKLY